MRLVLLGDVMLGRLVNERLATASPEYPWGDTLPLLRAADALIINLECVVSDRGEPWPFKTFTFRTDAKNIDVLTAARVTVATLANNHSLDYGPQALGDCLATLLHRGIRPAGAGASLEAARRPAVCAAGGLRIAVVAFTDDMPEWEAGAGRPGVSYVPLGSGDPRFDRLLETVREAKDQSHVVVVSAHWGPNWGYTPLPEHVEAAHLCIDHGADVVFGHSPHVMRGIELYRGRPILFSCGDYVDDYAVNESEPNDESFAFCLDYDRDRIRRLLLVPTVIRRCQARRAHGADRARVLRRMQALCAGFHTEAREVSDGLEIVPTPAPTRSGPGL
jgi:poly-gamma-glutamate capsule biosynthesis protein CapA/YwtB (metallophosphatase superfamily)